MEAKELGGDTCNYYEVVGAGKIEIGKTATACCGHRAGFVFGVSWGRTGYCGGVLSRSEAKKLADHIYSTLEKCTDTEAECYNKTVNSLSEPRRD